MSRRVPQSAKHPIEADGDALDMWVRETSALRAMFEEWEKTRPAGQAGAGTKIAVAEWQNGTVGKLLVEHVAVWLGAARDIVRTLAPDRLDGAGWQLAGAEERCRPLLSRLDELARGTRPISLATNLGYADAVDDLRAAISGVLGCRELPGALGQALSGRRGRLRTARYVRAHSPTHPGPKRWYSGVGPIVRAQAAYDRLRGVPWPEAASAGDSELLDRYDNTK
ncbi:MAG TPA: hypothetical protein VL984_06310 [Acidimicrobiales bacterium]|nr:hypothetical protein [Acidimicrobiales bacterium]